MLKNLGPLLSAYLNPDDHAFETVVFQANKPVVDGELILNSEIRSETVLQALLATTPSGWVTDQFLDGTRSIDDFAPMIAGNIWFCKLTALVNGWVIQVRDSLQMGYNQVNFPTPDPAPTKTTNLVILEVWRQLLEPAPSTTGKSPSGFIYRYGNVNYANDAQNFPDDLINPNVGAETTKRVQIQYRLRVVENVDLVQYADGMSDPAVVANTVPPNPTTPDGTPTAFNYVSTAKGHWEAGDGNPGNGLGTVDGYMYALPLCAVFRRNSSDFDRNSNQNGGGYGTFRPDGLKYDIMDARDIADLRQCVSLTGFDPTELRDKAFHLLLDNEVRTEYESTHFGPTPTGGMDGHTLLWCDQIGVPGAGDGIDTGNAVPAGALVRTFDSVARRFTDQPYTEIVSVYLDPSNQVPPNATWQNDSTVELNPVSLKISPTGISFSFASYAPPGVSIVDIKNLRFVGDGTLGSVSDEALFRTVTGLGTGGSVYIVLYEVVNLITGLTTEPLVMEILVMYPPGEGLMRTPTKDFGVNSVEINNPGLLPPNYTSKNQSFDYAHRGIFLDYLETMPSPMTMRARLHEPNATTVYLMEKAEQLISVQINGTPLTVGSDAQLSQDGRAIYLFNGYDVTHPDAIHVAYTKRKPFPHDSVQVSVFYEARARQAVKENDLPGMLRILPRSIATHVTLTTAGTTSPGGDAYPFPYAYVQTGGLYNSNVHPSVGDADLNASLGIEYQGNFLSTGYISPSTLLPYTPTTVVELTRNGGDHDSEGRTFYNSVVSGYLPNAFALPLATPQRHKTMLPILAELLDDTNVGKRGQLALVVLHRWCEDSGVSVAFDNNQTVNTSSASVYRLPGHPLVRGF